MDNNVRVGVGVILVRDNKILLGERIGAHGENTWATPGGHLELGESVEECAIREVLEETGLQIVEPKKVAFTNDIFEQEGKHYITLFVQAACPRGEASIMEPEKCKSWQWFALDNLPKPLFLSMQNLLKENGELNLT
ncbi:ADP-ribose pyrophosphatase [Pseudoalteromonas luteoviolacea]|uniref:ADP-ribose pyrophosphatase n=1 Tax=Pseudoalteromonas luteoviolacea TaxID=43657 RepID=A0A1C0TTS1_9GAMM|nr:NUDIX hydrolase [Pseudoalteromonas luteoviolacea]OCQ22721.1 ADP-ribose pyrophosphatase [Pseudoalteromonas luteoviolacea]